MFFFLIVNMRIINQNLKKGIVKVKTENLDDLWYLSHIIDINDLVRGQSLRKIKIGKGDERKVKVVKKKVFIEVKTEKIALKDDILRVSGIITQAPEDIPKGSHHTLNIEDDSFLTIVKEKWLKFQLDKLKQASVKQPDILICILDREDALFALSRKGSYEIISSIKGDVEKKGENVEIKGDFYSEIIKVLEEYSKRYKVKDIIVASPAFWKENLMNKVKDGELKQKITMATCSSVDKNAINEILKRPEIREVLRQDRVALEITVVDELLKEIAKQDLAAYGIKEVGNAANLGAVKMLLVSDKFVQKMRDDEKYEQLDSVMKIVDQTKGEIHIVSSEHDGGKKLDGLGGVGAILRYRIN